MDGNLVLLRNPDKFLIIDLVRAHCPGAEGSLRFLAHDVGGGDGALLDGQVELVVDDPVVKAGAGGVFSRGGVVNLFRARPVDGRHAHRARFATGIDLATAEDEAVQRLAGGADGHDLAVCGGVIVGGDPVDATGDDLAVFHDDRAEGPAPPGLYVLFREGDGFGHVQVRVHMPMKR